MNFRQLYTFTIIKFVNFKYRKYVHYSLLFSIVLFQIILFLSIYNEFYNENKLEEIKDELQQLKGAESQIQNSSIHFFQTQNDFINFLTDKSQAKFEVFQNDVQFGLKEFDTLNNSIAENSSYINYFKENCQEDYKNFENAKNKIDSLRKANPITNTSNFETLLDLKKFDYSQILNSVKIETTVEVDSVKKKGFFGRLGSAISGNVDVQKEKVNIVVSMKFGKNVSTGNVQEQLGNAFKKTNEYYQDQLKQLRLKVGKNKNSENELLLKSFEFLDNTNAALQAINTSFNQYKNNVETQYNNKQTETNTIRKISVFGAIVLVLFVSFILIVLTRLAFGYERRLIEANKRIQENLIFKDKIVSMISHEIRTPLSILSLYSGQLKNQTADPMMKQLFESISFTTKSANLLANQILEFSKNEQKKLMVNPVSFNVKDELSEVLQGLKSLVEENKNQLVINLEVSNDVIVQSDIVKIYQIFYNLVGNANKFTEKGTITVEAKVKETEKSNFVLDVSIADTGKGIRQEDIAAVFSNFYQSVAEEKVHNLGAGLGLYLCKELIELLNGKIIIESSLNKGTIVRFSIKLSK
jgi:two-component system, NarL family, sensor histidine kinase BarA